MASISASAIRPLLLVLADSQSTGACGDLCPHSRPSALFPLLWVLAFTEMLAAPPGPALSRGLVH